MTTNDPFDTVHEAFPTKHCSAIPAGVADSWQPRELDHNAITRDQS